MLFLIPLPSRLRSELSHSKVPCTIAPPPLLLFPLRCIEHAPVGSTAQIGVPAAVYFPGFPLPPVTKVPLTPPPNVRHPPLLEKEGLLPG